VSLVPYLAPSGELKTKPTQHSVAALRSIGITPDALILRCDREVPEALKNKIALMCDVDIDGVISTPDAKSIYDIPKVLHREELDAYVVRRLNLPFRDVDWTEWDDLLRRVHEPHETVRIALVGKYVDLSDAYLSVTEALRAGGFRHRAKVEMVWVPSDDCESAAGATSALADVHGVLIPADSASVALRARSAPSSMPGPAGCRYSGSAWGLQCIVIEAARSVGLTEANSAEFEPGTPDPVISTMADQEQIVAGEADLGGTMRLGPTPRCSSRIRLWPRHMGPPRCPNGTGTAMRSTTLTATGSPKADCSSPGPRPTATWWSSSNTRRTSTRSSSVPRPTPN